MKMSDARTATKKDCLGSIALQTLAGWIQSSTSPLTPVETWPGPLAGTAALTHQPRLSHVPQ